MTAPAPAAYDVVVVGAGVAGVSCAIEAARLGGRVVVLDAGAGAGGTASVAGGGTCIAGSELQRRLGLDDSPDLALDDWLKWGGDSVDREWAEAYLRDSDRLLFRRLAGLGVEWITAQPREGNSVPRWHQPRGGGATVMRLLEQEARRLGEIEWLPGHRVVELVRSGGAVVGVRALGPRGETELRGRAVVVASGGFNNNHDMVAKLASVGPDVERVLLGGGLGARGELHGLLDELGAQFTQLDAVWMFPYGTPDHRSHGAHRGLAVRGIEGDVWINDEGRRFHDETRRSGATGTAALLSQPRGRCWSVIDARIAARMTIADPYYRENAQPIRSRIEEFLATSPYVVSASTLAELAARMDVDAAALADAVGAVNRAIARGLARDPEHDKPLAGLDPIAVAPYYAIRFHPVARKNLGGVRTDRSCRVLDTRDRPIAGLFAAGEVAGMAGGRINGRAALEGTSFGPSLYSGMVAGQHALA